jgi:hypothetical protein
MCSGPYQGGAARLASGAYTATLVGVVMTRLVSSGNISVTVSRVDPHDLLPIRLYQ